MPGYRENLNSECCYIRRGIVIVWKKEKKDILDKDGKKIVWKKEKKDILDKDGKKIKTLVLEERD
jgi:hypothetical protein